MEGTVKRGTESTGLEPKQKRICKDSDSSDLNVNAINVKHVNTFEHPFELCDVHTEKVCDIFCDCCRKVLCVRCLATHHKTHQWRMLDDFVEERQTHLIAKLTEKSDEFKDILDSEKQGIAKYFKETKEIKSQIVQQTDKIITEVQTLRDSKLRLISGSEKREKEQALKASKDIQAKLDRMQSLINKLQEGIKTFPKRNVIDSFSDAENISQIPPPMARKTLIPTFKRGRFDIKSLGGLLGELNYTEDLAETIKLQYSNGQDISGVFDVCPEKNGGVWCVLSGSGKLVHVDGNNVIKELTFEKSNVYCESRSKVVTGVIIDNHSRLFVIFNDCGVVYEVDENTGELSEFARSKERVESLCLSANGQVMVNLKNELIWTNRELRTYDDNGIIVSDKRIRCNRFSRITCPTFGHVIVINNEYEIRLYRHDYSGDCLHTWTAAHWDQPFSNFKPGSITHDSKGSIFITDKSKEILYIMDSDGKNPRTVDLQRHGIVKQPISVAMDTSGRLWLGCMEGTLYIMDVREL